MSLPLKTFYTLDEAVRLFHSLFPQRVDIDVNYFLMLGIKQFIRLAIKKSDICVDDKNGVINLDNYEGSDDPDEIIEHIAIIRDLLSCCDEKTSFLVVNESYIEDFIFYNEINLNEIRFDNFYSVLNNYFPIPNEYIAKLGFFSFANKLHYSKLYDMAMFSKKRKIILDRKDLEANGYPLVDEDYLKDDWAVGFWFKDSSALTESDYIEDITIKTDDLYLFGEDLQLLLDGKHREPIENNSRIKKNNVEVAKEQIKLHPKRANSINQIIYALAKMADLDLSQHQSAYTQLEAFCNNRGIEIPKKDTSGNLFKEIYRAFNLENSK
ncbi:MULTISPECIES: hypothetical protein [Acinetobacter]|uniref:Uncharacterized protein n=1 Tax=Acinetobacter piscicola TaxID=2006115 RepID=A0A7S6VT58_9GAMM|nr:MULTISPECIES: hypothetical protein [Acinetobacter]QOW44426.1 hypothetical protein G0028_17765 [Acinetobacter piscicola]